MTFEEMARRVGPVGVELARYRTVRAATEALTRTLTPEDMAAQSMADASPVKWHLAHTTWFFETFLLTPHLEGYAPFDTRYDYLFNSYYEAVGPRQPRPERGLLTRPGIDEVFAYRAHVDAAMARLLDGCCSAFADLFDLGLAHEQQHQELILMDVLHLFAQSPLRPAFSPAAALAVGSDPGPMGRVTRLGGLVEIGHAGDGFGFDNEGPRHRAYLTPYKLADRLVTNAEWLGFMADGGYQRAEYWLAQGWALLQAQGWTAPLYWEEAEGGWRAMTLQGLRALAPHAPVTHISYFEAEAYAAWAGARLPTEAEWEHAAAGLPVEGNLWGAGQMGPAATNPGTGLRQVYGDVWEWTRSAYGPYPGFRPPAGAVGEYNGKFMSGQMVLRGGSCATPDDHVRASYRNFFHPDQRWMFSGLRLAWDCEPDLRAFADDVREGLDKEQKSIPPKYFYDARGSALFEAICDLPEYYPTRTETALLARIAPDIAALVPKGSALIEFGSGASTKTRLLLDQMPDLAAYCPIDISVTALDGAADAIRTDYPGLLVEPLVGDFAGAVQLPQSVAGLSRIGFFPGSTIGNFEAVEAAAFLRSSASLLGQGAYFLVGIDLVKDVDQLISAYDDAQGVTAAFNLNLLTRLNEELDADFNLDQFTHLARWNAGQARIEMHLVSRVEQTVRVGGRAYPFAAGETLHTENSHKFTLKGFAAMADQAGWDPVAQWSSAEPDFGVALLRAR